MLPEFAPCPLCDSPDPTFYAEREGRRFADCPNCGLVFQLGGFLSSEVERARYAAHNNDPSDPRYRDFLDRLALPLAEKLPTGAEGLDFGCGPGPALSLMLTERGFPTLAYDPHFFPDRSLLERRWDFVTATEVLEHLQRPGETIAGIASLLRPGGTLAVMTRLLTPETDFTSWWYVRDETHVCFWRANTFAWIAKHFGWTLETPHPDVGIFSLPQ